MRAALARLLPATAWTALGSAASQGATLLGNVLVANALGTAGFGIYSFFQTTISSWALVAQGSTGLMSSRYVSAYSKTDPSRAARLIGASTVVALVGGVLAAGLLLAFGDRIAARTAGAALADASIVAAAAGVLFASMTLFQAGVLLGLQQYKSAAQYSLALSVLFVGLPVWGALVGGPMWSIVGLSTAYCFRFLVNAHLIRRSSGARGAGLPLGGFSEFAGLFLRFALPASISGLTISGSVWFATFVLLGQEHGSTLVGLIGACMALRMLVVFVPAQISNVSVVFLTRHLAAGDEANYAQTMRTQVWLTAAAAVVVAAVLQGIAPWILQLFGPGFELALPAARILLCAAAVESVSMSLYQSLPSRAQMWRSLGVVALPRDLLFAVGAWWAIPRYLTEGFAIAMLCGQLVGLAGVWVARALPAAREERA